MKKPALRNKAKTTPTPNAAAPQAPQVQAPQQPQERSSVQKLIDSSNAIQNMRAALNATLDFYANSLQESISERQKLEASLQQVGAQFNAQTIELKALKVRTEELEAYLESLEANTATPAAEPTEA